MLSCINIIYNNTDCLNDRFTYFYTTAQSRGTTYDGLSGQFFIVEIYYFSLFVPIYNLVHAVDTMPFPLTLLRTTQNLL